MDSTKKIFLSLILAAALVAPATAQTTSIDDNVQYTGNTQFFSGDVLTLSYTGNTASEVIQANVDRDRLNTIIPNGEATKSFNFETSKSSEHAEYSMKQLQVMNAIDYDPVMIDTPAYQTSKQRDLIRQKCADVNRDGRYSAGVDFAKGGTEPNTQYVVSRHIMCAQVNQKRGTVAGLRTPDVNLQTEWTMSYGDKQISKTLSNNEMGEGSTAYFNYRGDRVAVAQFTSSGVTGERYEGTGGTYVMHSNLHAGEYGYNSEGWKLISQERYDQYIDYVNDGLGEDLVAWGNKDAMEPGTTKMTQSDVSTQMDDSVYTATQAYTDSPINKYQNLEFEGGGIDNGVVKATISGATLIPNFQFWIKSGEDGFVEIEKTAGEPRIIPTETDNNIEVPEIGSGIVELTAENVGSASGEFEARITQCSSNFEPESTVKDALVDSGEKVTWQFQVSYSGTASVSEQSGSCSFEVQDVASGATDTVEAEVTGVQAKECSEGDRRESVVDGEPSIVECTSNEMGYKVIQQCDAEGQTVVRNNGVLECGQEGGEASGCQGSILGMNYTKPGCYLQNQWDKATSWAGNLLFMLDIMVVSIAGFFGFKAGSQIFYEWVATGIARLQNQAVKAGFGLFFGILSMLMVFSFFANWRGKLILILVMAAIIKFWSAVEALMLLGDVASTR